MKSSPPVNSWEGAQTGILTVLQYFDRLLQILRMCWDRAERRTTDSWCVFSLWTDSISDGPLLDTLTTTMLMCQTELMVYWFYYKPRSDGNNTTNCFCHYSDHPGFQRGPWTHHSSCLYQQFDPLLLRTREVAGQEVLTLAVDSHSALRILTDVQEAACDDVTGCAAV